MRSHSTHTSSIRIFSTLLLSAFFLTFFFAPSLAAETAFIQSKFVQDDLGTIDVSVLHHKSQQALIASTEDAMESIVLEKFEARGGEEMRAIRVSDDDRGNRHVRFRQYLNGLPVVGAEMVLHIDAAGSIYGVNGEFAPSLGLDAKAAVEADAASQFALKSIGLGKARATSAPELTYVLSEDAGAVLAWTLNVRYRDANGPQHDTVFIDAESGEIVVRHPRHHYARALNTYDCDNGTACTALASDSSNMISTGDTALDAAHNYAIAVYDYYADRHGRDSYDDNGATMVSRVHYSSNYNNVYWNGSAVTYGDGDGNVFLPLSQAVDIVAHEWTHGVTAADSGLIYQNESGALNEAWSDIFGAVLDRQEGASVADTWLVAEAVFTPGVAGDAIRVMNNPTAMGHYDYYPTRYVGTQNNGGTHWNSGIANLAFVLAVEGGTHPTGATTNNVAALDSNFDTSLGMAADVFYDANKNCLTASSTFESARLCTSASALSIHGWAACETLESSWDAVGVPGDYDCGDPPPPPGPPELENGVTVSGLSADRNGTILYVMHVPANAENLTFTITGGSGDADLYVRLGEEPTTSNYDCRPYMWGNEETCVIGDVPVERTYYVKLRAYQSFNGVSLTGSYDYVPPPVLPCNYDETISGLSGSRGSWIRYTREGHEFGTDCNQVTVQISGGSNTPGADLYVRYGSQPTTSSYDCRPYLWGNEETCTINDPQLGTYHIGIRGYASYSGVQLRITSQ